MVMFEINTLVNIALVGLGLLMGLYAVISDKIKDLQNEKKVKKTELEEKETKILSGLTEKASKKMRKSLKDIWKKSDKIKSGESYHYNYGYFVSGILFMSAIIISFIYTLVLDQDIIQMIMQIITMCLVSLGLFNFFYVWTRTMLDMRLLLRAENDIKDTALEDKSKKS